MPRWREPREPSSPYITPEGYRGLETELENLWQRRTGVTRALSAAAAEGDRSENAEYIYRKKELREIDSRIRYLQRRMPSLRVVTEVSDPGRIFFGALVTLEDEAGEETSYRIVGPDELDARAYGISIDSPLARALLGRSLDEEITVTIASGTHRYYITGIDYP